MQLSELIKDESLYQLLLSGIEKDSHEIIKLLTENNIVLNLKEHNLAIDPETKVSPLNLFHYKGTSKDSLCAIAISFKKEAYLGVASGIQFFSDKEGISMVNHIFNSQNDRKIKKIPPILMNHTELYYKFYHHSTGANPGQRTNFPSHLPCVIYGIPYSWTSCCWMIDTLTSVLVAEKNPLYFDRMCALLKISIQLARNISGPNIIKQMVYKLVIRVIRKLAILIRDCCHSLPELFKKDSKTLLQDMYGINKEYLESVSTNSDLMKPVIGKKNEDFPFYSSYTQDFLEMISTLITPVTTEVGVLKIDCQLGEDVDKLIKILNLKDHFSTGEPLKPEIKEEVLHPLSHKYSMKNFIVVDNLPLIPVVKVKELILDTLEKRKGILAFKDLDVFVDTDTNDMCEGKAVVFIEGWRPPVTEEDLDSPIKLEEKEPEVYIPQEWNCVACTFVNPEAVEVCSICGTPKLPYEPPEDDPEDEEIKEVVDLDEERIKYWVYDLWKAVEEYCVEQKDKDLECKRLTSTKVYQNGEYCEDAELSILLRISTKEFQDSLDIVLETVYSKNPDEIGKEWEVKTLQEFNEKFKETTPWELFDRLSKVNYDFWLSKIEDNNQGTTFTLEECKQLIKLFEKDLCNSRSNSIHYYAYTFRRMEDNIIATTNYSKDNGQLDYTNFVNYQCITNFNLKYPIISKWALSTIRQGWSKILVFNSLINEVLPFINMSEESQIMFGDKCLSFGSSISKLRDLLLIYNKNKMEKEIMHKTALSRSAPPQVKIERLKMANELEKKEANVDHNKNRLSMKNKYVFLTAFQQLKEIPSTSLRPIKPSGSGAFIAFEVVFKGEHVQGQAGPYRQLFSDISAELQPSLISGGKDILDLFIPSVNNKDIIGESRDKFIINPDACTSMHLQLFNTLGVLMGCSLRTSTHLTLNLPRLFWKSLVNREINVQDLNEIDQPFINFINHIKQSTKEHFEAEFNLTYEYSLSNGRLVELVKNGRKKKVTYNDRFDFAERILFLRITESKKQMRALRKGLTKLIPEPFLMAIPEDDLEMWICGKSEINFEMLYRHTIYSGYDKEDQIIKNFWTMLHSLKPSDKLRFIKFCWGQVRLPASDEEYEKTQTRLMIKKGSLPTDTEVDKMFPKADTCFFNFELPQYSSLEIMREKILIAINLDCDSMNAEHVLNELNEDGRSLFSDEMAY